MADLVAELLERDSEKLKNLKPISVEKDFDLEFDLGNLLAVDSNIIDVKEFEQNKEEFLKSLARDNTQLLINKIWELPIERFDGIIIAKLPQPKARIPREKPIPKERPPTKWEEFAKLKGIRNTKKSKLVWDENLKEWKPRWGYKRVNDEKNDWMLEVPVNADPYEDQFAKRKNEKSERVSKNEYQRLRNIARARKIPVAGLGLAPTVEPQKEQITKARHLAKVSTASVGKFTENLPKEKPERKSGKKRKFEPNIGNMKREKETALGILNNIEKKKPKMDIEVAVTSKQFKSTVEEKKKIPERSAKRRNKDKRGRSKGKRGQYMKGKAGKGKASKGKAGKSSKK